jgi:hypothetical protein
MKPEISVCSLVSAKRLVLGEQDLLCRRGTMGPDRGERLQVDDIYVAIF